MDTVGAGGLYNEGFISAIISGRDLTGGNTVENAVSSYQVSCTGARHCPHAEQLTEFLNTHETFKEEQ